MGDLETADLNKQINEEYKIWKKNSPFLYDLVITHALDWPSLTVQWLPDKVATSNTDFTVHRLILGTHTSDSSEKNYLHFAHVSLPNGSASAKKMSERLDELDKDKGEVGEYSDTKPRVQSKQSILHDGEVNRARYMPQNPDIVATKTNSGNVLVFDRTKHPNQPKSDDDTCKPDITLKGHEAEGYGLNWNSTSLKEGHLISASEDTTVCEWDIRAGNYSRKQATLDPVRIYRGHSSVVEDVQYKAESANIFASVGDDKLLMLWDNRQDQAAEKKENAHDQEINAVAWCPSNHHLLLTGSADKTVVLWDSRNLKAKLHTFIHHTDEVLGLAWSPHNETIFASSSSDRRLMMWDASRIGLEQTPEDIEDGPPELLFMHGGHTARPSDFSWSQNENFTLASTSEDNVLQIWQPSRNIVAADNVAIDVDELE